MINLTSFHWSSVFVGDFVPRRDLCVSLPPRSVSRLYSFVNCSLVLPSSSKQSRRKKSKLPIIPICKRKFKDNFITKLFINVTFYKEIYPKINHGGESFNEKLKRKACIPPLRHLKAAK